MGWFDTLLKLADLGTIAYQATQQQKIRILMEQNTQAQEAELAIQAAVKEYIFRIDQVKEDMLLHATKKQIAVAAALRYLELDIQKRQISAGIFSELSDKAYFGNTLRSIRQNCEDLCEQMTPEQRDLVETTGRVMVDFESIRYLTVAFNVMSMLSAAKTELSMIEAARPGRGATRDQMNKWSGDIARQKEVVVALEKQIDAETFERTLKQQGTESREFYDTRFSQMRELLGYVFGDLPLPKLTMNEITE